MRCACDGCERRRNSTTCEGERKIRLEETQGTYFRHGEGLGGVNECDYCLLEQVGIT